MVRKKLPNLVTLGASFNFVDPKLASFNKTALSCLSLESTRWKKQLRVDRGDGQVVSVLLFYFDDPSSNPADAYSFFCKICV